MAKCLATDPGQRYQSASEILNDLELWHGGSGKVTRLSRIGPRFRLVSPSTTWKWITLSVSVVVVVLTAGFFAFRSWLPRPPRLRRRKPFWWRISVIPTGDSVFDGTVESMFNYRTGRGVICKRLQSRPSEKHRPTVAAEGHQAR